MSSRSIRTINGLTVSINGIVNQLLHTAGQIINGLSRHNALDGILGNHSYRVEVHRQRIDRCDRVVSWNNDWYRYCRLLLFHDRYDVHDGLISLSHICVSIFIIDVATIPIYSNMMITVCIYSGGFHVRQSICSSTSFICFILLVSLNDRRFHTVAPLQ